MRTKSLKAIGLAFLLAVASVALYTGCMTVGGTGEQHLNLMGEQQEIQMGREADELGVRYMAGVHENLQELISVMQTLEQVSELSGGKAIPEWSSTHPTPANREQRLAEQIKSLGVGEHGYEPVDRDGYLQRLSGMVYGPDPREGYSQDSTFYHPEMRFLFVFPNGWKIIKLTCPLSLYH